MEVLLENIIAYLLIGFIFVIIFAFYLRGKKKLSEGNKQKVIKARELGLHEPVSLHPVINYDICIGSAACVAACPEKDILGIINGRGETINASRCVGHGACFHACPVEAITLVIGTEQRGVQLPHVGQNFESNVPGIFIAGELGGMGLIKNAVEQGRQATENIKNTIKKSRKADYDVVIIGAGPAGISASLTAKKNNMKFATLEQDTLGGTVYSFPRAKIVMTSPMDLPLHGKVKLIETSKTELLELWKNVLAKNNIKVRENEKVESIIKVEDYFEVETKKNKYKTAAVLLAIGRRGTPRKLGVSGEGKEKVAYKLLEPELIHKQNVLVVGGGDSAIESALLLEDEGNNVTISYRSDSFKRLKPKNLSRINDAINGKRIKVIFNSNVSEILEKSVILSNGKEAQVITVENDLVYIFAGGELPNQFLSKIGIEITEKFGEAILKH